MFRTASRWDSICLVHKNRETLQYFVRRYSPLVYLYHTTVALALLCSNSYFMYSVELTEGNGELVETFPKNCSVAGPDQDPYVFGLQDPSIIKQK
jgi:hypothetical protein